MTVGEKSADIFCISRIERYVSHQLEGKKSQFEGTATMYISLAGVRKVCFESNWSKMSFSHQLGGKRRRHWGWRWGRKARWGSQCRTELFAEAGLKTSTTNHMELSATSKRALKTHLFSTARFHDSGAGYRPKYQDLLTYLYMSFSTKLDWERHQRPTALFDVVFWAADVKGCRHVSSLCGARYDVPRPVVFKHT